MSKVKRLKEKARHQRKQVRKEEELAERAQLQEEDEEEELLEDEEPSAVGDQPLEGDEEESDDDEPEDARKEIRKDYYPEMSDMYSMGPTSFEELDALKEAQERASEVHQVTYEVQDLVRNILHYPTLDPKEKATRIQNVAGEFEERVAELMMDDDSDDMQKDMEVLQAEVMLAMDTRQMTPLAKGLEWVDMIKRKLSYKARKKLPKEEFALPDKKKYPLNDKAHIRNALARAAQQIKRGGPGAADAKAALPKIRAAAKRMGIGMEKGILIEKDAKGDWRWIGRPTNNFIDWQKDIISKSAHEKYAAWLDANPEMAPVFLTWHIPGTAREHPADFWMEKDGALIMSGILTEAEARALLRMQKETDLGMSFQGLGMRLDKSDPRVVTDYWMYEVSDLPLDQAANPFTNLETMTKEVGMDKLEYLTKIMGSAEKAKAYLEKTGQMQKQLQEAGITSKEKGEEKTADGEKQSAISPQPSAPLDVTAIMKQVAEEYDIEGLNAFVAQAQEDHEKLEVLEGLVKELQGGLDAKLAEVLTPPVARFAWSQSKRASQSEDTKLQKDGKDEKLSKSEPGVPKDYWLSEISGVAPVTPQ